MQIALPYYCKIEFGALSKDSITEKTRQLPPMGKLSYNVLNLDGSTLFCVSKESPQCS